MIKVLYTHDGHNLDVSDWVTHITWSGDIEQASRKLEFTIAYNPLDTQFTNNLLDLGGSVRVIYDDATIFTGKIFYRKRASNSMTFDFTCYDLLLYAAKSKVNLVYDAVPIGSAIQSLLSELGLPAGDIPEFKTKVSFICDAKTGTEVLNMLFDRAKAETGKEYTAICLDGHISIIEKGHKIEGYVATNYTDITDANHSESIEDMINRVKLVDEKGTVIRTISNDDNVKNFGVLQDIFKMQPVKPGETVNNEQMAKAMLKDVKQESSMNAIGNINCISGYTIEVQEEQLKGNFYIKSDTHYFENNIHTMDLSLEYLGGAENGEN